MKILQINQLSKRYGTIKALDRLSLSVEKGNIFGLLGPNGSGKTTTLAIVLGILKQNSGSFEWFEGKYGDKARLRTGVLLETPNFYPYLNADDNLDIIAHIKGVSNPNHDQILDLVSLQHRRKSNFSTYSLGMKQRLAIAAAMVGDPEVLIFDEPTNGLDPQGIADIRTIIKNIADQGKTIIMASHILDEVEKVCSHVAIIKNGVMLAQGNVGSIINDDITIEIASEDLFSLKNFLSDIPAISQVEQQSNKLILSVDPSFSAAELNQLAFQKGLILTHLVARSKSLETEFLEITKQ